MSVRDEKFYNDPRVKELREDSKDDKEITNNSTVMNAIAAVQRQVQGLTLGNAALKPYVKGQLPGGHEQAFSSTDLRHLEEIQKSTESLAPFMKHLGELTGAISAIQQITTSKLKINETREHNDNLGKSIYALQNGKSFGSIAPALMAGTARSGMTAAGTIGAGSWLYDMFYNGGALSATTNNAVALSNPGFMLSSLFGGIQGLGHGVGALAGKGLGLAGSLTGSQTLTSGATSLATLDPTIAGLIGTVSLIGTSIGAKKVLDNIIKNSPLSNAKRQNRFNLSHQFAKATDNPMAMQNYIQSNNILRQLQSQNLIQDPANALMVSKLNEIAYNTALLQDMYEVVANKGINDRNSGVRALNQYDKDISKYDPTGRDQINLFNNGKLSGGHVGFLRAMEGFDNIFKTFSASTYIKALSGGNTSPNQGKLTEALAGGDPDHAIKTFALRHGITRSQAQLLNNDPLELIGKASGSYEEKMLMSQLLIAGLLQLQASKALKGNGKDSIIGELAKLQQEQEEKMNQNMSLLQRTQIEFMRGLAKTPLLSALVPALNATGFLSRNAIGAAGAIGSAIFNPIKTGNRMISGVKDGWKNIKGRVIDSMRPDDVKNESTIRGNINAKALTLSEMADKATLQIPHLLQDIKWLLGSTDKAKVQDRYTGDYVTPDELSKRFKQKKKDLIKMARTQNEDESYFDMAGTWLKKKTFGIKDRDFRRNAMDNYSHIGEILNELSPDINSLQHSQTSDTKFRLNPRGANINIKGSMPGAKGTPLYSTLNFLNKSISSHFGNQQSMDPRDSYYQMMEKYIPLLEEIRDCVCKKCDCDEKGSNGPRNISAQKIKELQSKLNFLNKNPKGPIHNRTIMDNIKDTVDGDQKEKFYKVFYGNMPYLSRIFKLLNKQIIHSGMSGPNPNGSGSGSDSDDSWFGGWFDRGSKNPKGPKPAGPKAPGLWDKTKQYAGKGLSMAWDVAKFAGAGILMPILEGAAGLIGGATIAGAATVGAVSSIVGMVVDKVFFDGKYTPMLLEYLKNSWVGQSMTDAFNWIAESEPVQWAKKEFGSRGSFGKTSGEQFKYWDQNKINAQLARGTTTSAKLNILNQNAQFIDPSMRQKIIDQILSEDDSNNTNKYGFTLSAANVNEKYQDIMNMDPVKRMEFYKDYNNTQATKLNAKVMSQEESNAYKDLNNKMQKMFIDANKDKRDQDQKDKDKAQIDEILKTLNETQIQSNESLNSSIQSVVNQNAATNSAIIKGFSEQVGSIAQQQGSITNMLSLTAKLMQKPNTFVLDPTVTKLFPALN